MGHGILYAVFPVATGWVGVAASAGGLRRLTLPQPSAEEARRLVSEAGASESPEFFRDLAARLRAYYDGERVDFPDGIDPSIGTPFQQRVWAAARRIPYGRTQSYGWVAAQIGQPAAARAVGNALGRNPFPVIVPCHRVVAANSIGGFSGNGGEKMKRRLLALEAGTPQSTV